MATHRLEFRILGPLEVRLDGAPVRIGGPRQRALLALLLLSANEVVSRDRLIEELLGGQTPDSAERALRVQVARLRAALGPSRGESRLVAHPPGYVLRVEPDELDLEVFERLLSEGRRALEEDEPALASARIREALSLWRGRPLADLEFEPFARLEVERLEELRIGAIEDRIDAELGLGWQFRLVSELETLVAEQPLRERLRGQLMVALYRSGRQADALEAYRTGRSLLTDELGLEPGPQLRQLEQAILRQDNTLEVDRRSRQVGTAVLADPLPASGPAERQGKVTPPGRRPGRGLLAGLAFAVAGAVAAIVIPVETGGPAARIATLDSNALALVSSRGDAVTAVVPLPAPPAEVARGFGSLWVSERDRGRVVRVDPGRRAIEDTIPVGGAATAIATGAGDVWVVNNLAGTLYRIDPVGDTATQKVRVGDDPSAVVASGGSIWVANHGDGTVEQIDARTGRPRRVIKTGNGPSALAVSGGALWVANDGSGTVTRLDAAKGAITDTIEVGDAPAALAATSKGVWVLDRLDSTLSQIDPLRDIVDSTISIPGAPSALTTTPGSVWVTDASAGVLRQVDTMRDVLKRTIRVGGNLQALTADGGLWVATDASGRAHRGGTLTMVASNGIPTIDPAASTSWNIVPPQLLGLTNDGLVTLDHVAGSDGGRLVPDLALSLPRPTNGGRVYTFQLRPSVRYSSGGRVTPVDVRHSFERLFELRSSGADEYSAISGARACSRSRKPCDLSRGIAIDEQANTVTFHLSRPDLDFLYKLTLPYAFVLPASTPSREATSSLPATGPYMIARYLPQSELLLVRNPRFRVWSAAAQPAGYPDRIVMRVGLTGAQGAALVAQGKADFMPNLGPIPGQRAFFLVHHPSAVQINPTMNTAFLFLNVRAAPFNDIRVRRALNFALDRARTVSTWGGTAVAQPTCQILPPPMAGYRRYCPYTSHPDEAGRWRGADLTRAERLVAASGTRGMRVIVWDTPGFPGTLGEGNATVEALTELGYRASLQMLPASRYYTYTNDSRKHPQVIDGGWSSDFASADDFLGKLTCDFFVPRNGVATTDASEFCDPAFDRQVARARALQITNPPAANALWAQLDRELTDRAIWLPTVTPDETDLTSSRVGNYQYNPVWGALLDQLWVR